MNILRVLFAKRHRILFDVPYTSSVSPKSILDGRGLTSATVVSHNLSVGAKTMRATGWIEFVTTKQEEELL